MSANKHDDKVEKQEKQVRVESVEVSDSERNQFVKQFALNRSSFTGHPIDDKLVKEANIAYDNLQKLVKQ